MSTPPRAASHLPPRTAQRSQGEEAPSAEHFQSVTAQAVAIAYLYSVFGLWSIPVLTVCTVISMANVFTTGDLATFPWVVRLWAFIFAVSIDVNIVRLFVEGTLEYAHKRRGSGAIAYLLGIVLGGVTAISLFIEGIEQAIGLSWHSQIMQTTLTVLVFLRVACVVVLFIREGHKLGVQVYTVQHARTHAESRKEPQALPIQKRPFAMQRPAETRPAVPGAALAAPVTQEAVQPHVLHFPSAEPDTRTAALAAIEHNPAISLAQLATILQVRSRSTARTFKQRALQNAEHTM